MCDNESIIPPLHSIQCTCSFSTCVSEGSDIHSRYIDVLLAVQKYLRISLDDDLTSLILTYPGPAGRGPRQIFLLVTVCIVKWGTFWDCFHLWVFCCSYLQGSQLLLRRVSVRVTPPLAFGSRPKAARQRRGARRVILYWRPSLASEPLLLALPREDHEEVTDGY